MAVPLFDTKTPLAPLRAEIDAKIAEVVDRGTFILGPEVAAFEAEFAAYLGARHAAGVANGTDALVLALRALGVGPGRVLRRGPGHVLRHRGDRPRRDHPEDEGRHRGPPVRQRRPDRGDRGAG